MLLYVAFLFDTVNELVQQKIKFNFLTEIKRKDSFEKSCDYYFNRFGQLYKVYSSETWL